MKGTARICLCLSVDCVCPQILASIVCLCMTSLYLSTQDELYEIFASMCIMVSQEYVWGRGCPHRKVHEAP